LAPARAQSINDLQRGFERPPDDAKIMMRWWWFGPAVTKPELEREMRLMKEGGIGGFEVQPVYRSRRMIRHLALKIFLIFSDEFIDSLRFVSAKARELGLRMDLNARKWMAFGGPQVSISDAAGMLRTEHGKQAIHGIPVPSIAQAKTTLAAFLVSVRSIPAASLIETCGPPKGHPLSERQIHSQSEFARFLPRRTAASR